MASADIIRAKPEIITPFYPQRDCFYIIGQNATGKSTILVLLRNLYHRVLDFRLGISPVEIDGTSVKDLKYYMDYKNAIPSEMPTQRPYIVDYGPCSLILDYWYMVNILMKDKKGEHHFLPEYKGESMSDIWKPGINTPPKFLVTGQEVVDEMASQLFSDITSLKRDGKPKFIDIASGENWIDSQVAGKLKRGLIDINDPLLRTQRIDLSGKHLLEILSKHPEWNIANRARAVFHPIAGKTSIWDDSDAREQFNTRRKSYGTEELKHGRTAEKDNLALYLFEYDDFHETLAEIFALIFDVKNDGQLKILSLLEETLPEFLFEPFIDIALFNSVGREPVYEDFAYDRKEMRKWKKVGHFVYDNSGISVVSPAVPDSPLFGPQKLRRVPSTLLDFV